jgi:hypothetical protein
MAPTTDTTFAAGTRRRLHNHVFGHAHRARRGQAIHTTTLAKDYPLFVPPKSTLSSASSTSAVGQPTGNLTHQPLPTSVEKNFLFHTLAPVAVAVAIAVILIVLVISGVVLTRKISRQMSSHHRKIEGSSKGSTDLVEEKQEDDFDEKSTNLPASLHQVPPAFIQGPASHLKHEARNPVQATMRPTWFAQTSQKVRTGLYSKNSRSPRETSPFLVGKFAELPQQPTWANHSSPGSLSYPMPFFHRLPEEPKDDCEINSGKHIALTPRLSLHRSVDHVAFTPSIYKALRTINFRLSKVVETDTIEEADNWKGDRKDAQEVGISTSVSTDRIVSPSAEERSCSEMVDTGSELTESLKIVGIEASAERQSEIFEVRGVQTGAIRLVSLGVKAAGEGEEDGDDEPSTAAGTEDAPDDSTMMKSSNALLPQPRCLVSARVLETSFDLKMAT